MELTTRVDLAGTGSRRSGLALAWLRLLTASITPQAGMTLITLVATDMASISSAPQLVTMEQGGAAVGALLQSTQTTGTTQRQRAAFVVEVSLINWAGAL